MTASAGTVQQSPLEITASLGTLQPPVPQLLTIRLLRLPTIRTRRVVGPQVATLAGTVQQSSTTATPQPTSGWTTSQPVAQLLST